MKRTNQQGFSVFETIMTMGVAAIIGLAGWNIYHQSHQKGSVSTSKVAKSIPVSVPAVSSANDLDKAAQTLDQAADSSSDTAQLDQELASF